MDQVVTENPEVERLQESAWGDVVPWSDYPQFDHPHFQSHGGYTNFRQTRIDDRENGRYRPFYENEADLALIRGQARSLATFTSTSLGAMESLTNYVIGSGPTFLANATNPDADNLATAVQRFIDLFVEQNDLVGGLDREIHLRSREDGEAFVALHQDRLVPRICLLEPDQVTEPDNTRQLDEWLGADGFQSFWTFGVHTRMGEHLGCQDFANPLGYHVVYDTIGTNWDYIPAVRAGAQVNLPTDAVMEHIKRNTSVKAKRGVSDFYAVQHDIEREAKLRRNTSEGAAIQAAIALIREHVPGTTESDVTGQVNANSVTDYQQETKNAGTRTVKVQKFTPGSVVDIPAGKKYHAGPMGSLSQPVFIEVAGYLLRSIGIRWVFPEYMISGDASNANFSSTLVAESPFVKAREADQAFYIRHFKSIVWKAIRLSWEAGRFDKWAGRWNELRQLVEIEVTLPAVASRDREAQARVNEIEHRNGIKSKRTWAAEVDIDYDAELENMKDEPAPAAGGDLSPAAQGALRAAVESSATPEDVRRVIREAWGVYP